MRGNVAHWEEIQKRLAEASGEKKPLDYVEPGSALIGVIISSIILASVVGAGYSAASVHMWWPF
jgi:hypothetical protein